jgi:hypothetical protein
LNTSLLLVAVVVELLVLAVVQADTVTLLSVKQQVVAVVVRLFPQ